MKRSSENNNVEINRKGKITREMKNHMRVQIEEKKRQRKRKSDGENKEVTIQYWGGGRGTRECEGLVPINSSIRMST